MNIENKLDNICRCCLTEEGVMKNMLLEQLGRNKIKNIYKICAGIDLDGEETTHKNVCCNCVDKLKLSYEFRELCQSSHNVLKERAEMLADVKLENLSDPEDNEPIFLYNTFDENADRSKKSNYFTQVFVKDKNNTFKLPPPIVIKTEEAKPLVRFHKETTESSTPDTKPEKVKIQPKEEANAEQTLSDDDDFGNNDDYNLEPELTIDEEKPKKVSKRKRTKLPELPEPVVKIKGKSRKKAKEPETRLDVSNIEATYMCYYCDVYLNTHKQYLEHRENHKTENISNRLARNCFLCHEMVPGYVKHLEEAHKDFRPNVCKICQVKFQSQNALKNHLFVHSNSDTFECLGCNKKFKTQNQRRSHIIKERHSNHLYHCPVCGLGTAEFITLHDHFTMEHLNPFSKQLFPCYKCKKVFSFNKHVLKHECAASSKRKYKQESADGVLVKEQMHKCDRCDQEFLSNDEMVCHKYTVCYARFSCTFRGCGLVFENAQRLSEHKRVHDQSVFVCDECGYSTTSEPKLLRHKTTHTTERAFNCPFPGCPATFKNKYSLYTHRTMHMERQYECHLCQKKFRFYTSIKDHMATHIVSDDLRRYACDFCAQRFVRPRDRERHLRIHTDERPMKCTLCPRTYRDSGNLNEHFRRAHAGICYECKDCGKTYKCKTKLREHLFVHRGFKPFVCPACPHQFTKKYLFVKHLLVHNIKFDEKTHGYKEMENFSDMLAASLRILNPNPEVAGISGEPPAAEQQPQQQQQQQLLQQQHQLGERRILHDDPYFALPPAMQQQLQQQQHQGNGQRPY